MQFCPVGRLPPKQQPLMSQLTECKSEHVKFNVVASTINMIGRGPCSCGHGSREPNL